MTPNRWVFQLRARNKSKNLLLPGVFSSLLRVNFYFFIKPAQRGQGFSNCIPSYSEFVPLHCHAFCAYSSNGQLKDATRIGTDGLAKPFLMIFRVLK